MGEGSPLVPGDHALWGTDPTVWYIFRSKRAWCLRFRPPTHPVSTSFRKEIQYPGAYVDFMLLTLHVCVLMYAADLFRFFVV